MDNWMNCQEKCQKYEQNVFYALCLLSSYTALDKKWYFAGCVFPETVQKQTLGEVGN